MAFIIAGVIFAGFSLFALVMLLASGMSDSPSASQDMNGSAGAVFITGLVIAGLVAGSHFIHFPSW